MDGRPHTETRRKRLEEELAKDKGPRWMKAKARELAGDAADAGLARAREEMDKRRRVDAEEELGRDDAESRSSDNAKTEQVKPSSSKDHVKRPETLRERPAESEEEDERTKKSRIAGATGQKRKEAATTPSHSRAKAKSADTVGQKRKSEEAATAPNPNKTKTTEPTGEK